MNILESSRSFILQSWLNSNNRFHKAASLHMRWALAIIEKHEGRLHKDDLMFLKRYVTCSILWNTKHRKEFRSIAYTFPFPFDSSDIRVWDIVHGRI